MVRINTKHAPTIVPSPLAEQTTTMEPFVSPFIITYDKAEQAPLTFEGLFEQMVEEREPYKFRGLVGRVKSDSRPILCRTRRQHLKTGDYSVAGFEHLVTVERKSLSDLYGTLASGRDRFEREHERMAEMVKAGGRCCVVVESSFDDALNAPPNWSNLHPHAVFGYAVSWPFRHGVPWVFAGTRRAAEEYTYRFLEMFWREEQEKKKDAEVKAMQLGIKS